MSVLKILRTTALFVSIAAVSGCAWFAQWACAQNLVTIDATAPVQPPTPVEATLGSSRNLQGQAIGVNSEYLTLDGKPWLPVMGEFHYSRYPESEWEQEILKMKAAGVQVVSTYVIWIHQEQKEGVFDWSGQRDLRRFVQLCAKHGMYAYPRIGPWSHAETRNGGLPDWVLKNGPVRQNDPVYLAEVQSFYAQIGKELQGLLWKDGGPVIGIQIENEYHELGPGKGDEHISMLKKMAIAVGLDVPLYTVTGWDGAVVPLDAVLPVFGGYPAAPWDGSDKKLPPSEVYAFRFGNRAAGSMGAIGAQGQSDASSYRRTPFLTAEVGDGIEDTYYRRPALDADDVAAIAPVMLGSGVNLLGYYTFHGGRNPDGGHITLQESQRTGYPTDVPVESYDFQAPLGEFGQERESLRKLKLINYFLNDFGAALAPMTPRPPAKTPSDPADTSVPRISARTSGGHGFIFVNNYVRGLHMPDRPGFQVQLRLPSGVVAVPESPIHLPTGAYGIWPVNLPLRGTTLRYSTAQLFKQVETQGETYFFFFAIPGIVPEFVLDPANHVIGTSDAVEEASTEAGLRLRISGTSASEIRLAGGVHLVLLPESQAETVWRVDDPSLLLLTSKAAFSDGNHWTIQSIGDPEINFGVFGTATPPRSLEAEVHSTAGDGIFHPYRVKLQQVELHVKVSQVQIVSPRGSWTFGPAFPWRTQAVPLAPDDADFKMAGVWKIDLPRIPTDADISNVFLQIAYQGDVARLYSDDHRLLDDNFWNGLPWSIGMKEIISDWRKPDGNLELRVLPLPEKFPMYLENVDELHFNSAGVADNLTSVQLVPQYQLVLPSPASQ
jgi:hypothetical protein